MDEAAASQAAYRKVSLSFLIALILIFSKGAAYLQNSLH